MSTDTRPIVTGNTYPVKDDLKRLGGTWDATAKGWRVPPERLAEARALVAPAKATTPVRRPSPTASRRPFRPCGYPGCNPHNCDQCDGAGYSDGRRY